MTFRAGDLDRLIDIQKATTTQDPSGQPIKNWATVAPHLKASYRPLAGGERYTNDQWVAFEQAEFVVRFQSALADINPASWRLIYPADSGSPAAVYSIMAALETEGGRREGIRILAARRPER